MYNPHNYAIQIEKILGTPQHLTGEIEKDPLTFLSSFLDKKYDSSENSAQLIEDFDNKYSKYRNAHLLKWDEEDAKQLINDLRIIFSVQG